MCPVSSWNGWYTLGLGSKPGSMARSYKLAFLGFNVLAATTEERLSDIARSTRNFDVVALVGTQRRCRLDDHQPVRRRVEGRVFVDAGWARGPLTNKSTGCGLLFGGRVKQHDLVAAWVPPRALAGRALAVRVRNQVLDAVAVALYFPPPPRKASQGAVYRRTCERLVEWARGLPALRVMRCTPLLFMDLNSGFGLTRRGSWHVAAC